MLTSRDVPTQKTQRNKAFCSKPVLTELRMQSKYVTKNSRADTSHVILTWPIRESQLSIQSDWLRYVHVTNGVRDHDADAELEQN